jgi:hypothetical protein
MKTTLLNFIARSSRFRLRTMLILVAAAVLPLGFFAVTESRRERFLRLATYHESRIQGTNGLKYSDRRTLWVNGRIFTERVTPRQRLLDLWHLALYHKYRDAARHPWLPLGADPPRPE